MLADAKQRGGGVYVKNQSYNEDIMVTNKYSMLCKV